MTAARSRPANRPGAAPLGVVPPCSAGMPIAVAESCGPPRPRPAGLCVDGPRPATLRRPGSPGRILRAAGLSAAATLGVWGWFHLAVTLGLMR